MLAASLLGAAAPSFGQPSRKPVRIGVLSSTSPEARSTFWDAFKDEMAKLDWIEGLDLSYIYRYTRGDPTRFDALAAELVAEKPDLIYASSVGAAVAAKRATRDIPIVFGFVSDPVGAGLVASLAKPGGNATEMSSLAIEVSSKYLELLREIRPQMRRAAVLATKDNPRMAAEIERAGRALKIEVDFVIVGDQTEIGQALDSIARKRPEGIVVAGPGLLIERRRIAERFASLRIPAIYPVTEFVTAGGLMSYSADLSDNLRRAAGYVDRILKGAKEQGIKIPQSLLIRATRVIE